MAESKNPTAVQIGQRIKQARKMAGYHTAAQLLENISDWGSSRLGNYEAGRSLPSPDDIKLLAKLTDASPCWIMFGLGPIRASGRDVQAIRHQNLVYLIDTAKEQKGMLGRLLNDVGLSRKKVDEYTGNPFLTIGERLARRCEKYAGKAKGWLDEQHVASDPICAAFPEDMRELMEVYSGLDQDKRRTLLQIA